MTDSHSGWTVFRLVNLRHLRQHWGRSLLTVLGVGASVMLVVAISAVNSTLGRAVDATATAGVEKSADLAIVPKGPGAIAPGRAAQIARFPGVRLAVPVVRETSLLVGAQGKQRAFVLGVPRIGSLVHPADPTAGQGSTTGDIILSTVLAASLGLKPGETVAVQTPVGRPRLRVAAVSGDSRLTSVNGGMTAVLPLRRVQVLFDRGSGVDIVYVFAKSGMRANGLRRHLQALLGNSILVAKPSAETAPYRRALNSITALMRLVQVLALLVMAFLVFHAMALAVGERSRDLSMIGVLGAKPWHAAAAFLLEAITLGLLGGAIGCALGYLAAANAIDSVQSSFQALLPTTSIGSVDVNPSTIALGIGSGVAVGLAGALLALRRIFEVEPIHLCQPASLPAENSKSSRLRLTVFGFLAIIALAVLFTGDALQQHQWTAPAVLALVFAGSLVLLPLLVNWTTDAATRGIFLPLGPIRALAGRGVSHNPRRVTVTVGAIAAISALAITIPAALRSIQGEVERVVSGWYMAPLYVEAPGSGTLGADQPIPSRIRSDLEEAPGIAHAYPVRYASADLNGRQMIIVALPFAEAASQGDELIREIDPADDGLISALRNDGILVSRLSARHLGVVLGDTLALPTHNGMRRFPVVGLFNSISSTDSLYIDYGTYRREMRDRRVDQFAIETDQGVSSAVAQKNLEALFHRRHLPATVATRTKVINRFIDALKPFFSLARGIGLIALLITALVVTNAVLIAILERRWDLAVQRLLGVSSPQFVLALTLEQVLMAGLGVALGSILGLILAWVVNSAVADQLAWNVAFDPSAPAIAAVAIETIAVAAVAAATPAWITARKSLIDALRAS